VLPPNGRCRLDYGNAAPEPVLTSFSQFGTRKPQNGLQFIVRAQQIGFSQVDVVVE